MELKRIANLIGAKTLKIEDIRYHSDTIGISILRNRFGSWENALKKAGLKITNHGKRYSDIECFENLLNVWTILGKQPSAKDMNKEISKVGLKAYIIRWGTWTKAIYAFSEKINSDEKEIRPDREIQKNNIEIKQQTKPKKEEDRREIRLGLRYKVLFRDNFKCVKCGDSPATNQTCKLHVDHIVPFSKGGKTILENLQTLCDKCNLGKGNRFNK